MATTRLGVGGQPRAGLGGEVIASANLGGTLSLASESQVVASGGTLTISLILDQWIAAGTGPIGTIAQSNAIIDGITSDKSESGGWNAQIRDVLDYTSLVRTSDEVATLTVPATAGYDITANETIIATIPSAVLSVSTSDVVSSELTIKADITGLSLVRDVVRDSVNNVVRDAPR